MKRRAAKLISHWNLRFPCRLLDAIFAAAPGAAAAATAVDTTAAQAKAARNKKKKLRRKINKATKGAHRSVCGWLEREALVMLPLLACTWY